MSISKKKAGSDNNISGGCLPLYYHQHQEELSISQKFALARFTKKFCYLSSCSITVIPAFHSLTKGKLTLDLVDTRRQQEDPLQSYITLMFPLCQQKTVTLSDFPTVSTKVIEPYRLKVKIEVTGIKFGQIVAYLKLTPAFVYTNSISLPKELTINAYTSQGTEYVTKKKILDKGVDTTALSFI